MGWDRRGMLIKGMKKGKAQCTFPLIYVIKIRLFEDVV